MCVYVYQYSTPSTVDVYSYTYMYRIYYTYIHVLLFIGLYHIYHDYAVLTYSVLANKLVLQHFNDSL